MVVPQGYVLRYDYVDVDKFRGFERYGAMQRDVILEKMGRFSEADGNQYAEDAPLVRWTDDGGFKVKDGRHAFLSLLGASYSVILVKWLEKEGTSRQALSDIASDVDRALRMISPDETRVVQLQGLQILTHARDRISTLKI